jgi:hypothetical protein
MCEWSIYRLFVLNRSWKRDYLQMMIFVCLLVMGHSRTKNAFWDVNNKKWRKECKLVSPFLFNNVYGLPVLTNDTKIPNLVFYVRLVDPQTICAKHGLETWLHPIHDIRICCLVMRHSTTKKAFCDVNNKKWHK